MAKEKKNKLGIKTSRYFTKTCSACGSEYPNWFTHCPQCGKEWSVKLTKEEEGKRTKTIKIVVKITEDEFKEPIKSTKLIFSSDQGKTWYQMKMELKNDFLVAELVEVPVGTVIIYYIEVLLKNDEKYIENNDGKYFYYKVGTPTEDSEESPPMNESQAINENIREAQESPKTYDKTQEWKLQNTPPNSQEVTIFGSPQTAIDPDLKICSHCGSKIKKMWSICPICGGKV
ncbi:MAG: hypothetical protein GF383_04920 [Candidatus Lokiarchaeota archaeon]|nr:hypothetical protein [Candidatus Lokiarchaeota archaeon]MBD3339184.1 hypothetical protein [Candidatus Lokiarchaeota archaeon]